MEDFLIDDPASNAIEVEAEELQDAIDELTSEAGEEFGDMIDDAAEIDDKDEEECEFDPNENSEEYRNCDIGNSLPDIDYDGDNADDLVEEDISY